MLGVVGPHGPQARRCQVAPLHSLRQCLGQQAHLARLVALHAHPTQRISPPQSPRGRRTAHRHARLVIGRRRFGEITPLVARARHKSFALQVIRKLFFPQRGGDQQRHAPIHHACMGIAHLFAQHASTPSPTRRRPLLTRWLNAQHPVSAVAPPKKSRPFLGFSRFNHMRHKGLNQIVVQAKRSLRTHALQHDAQLIDHLLHQRTHPQKAQIRPFRTPASARRGKPHHVQLTQASLAGLHRARPHGRAALVLLKVRHKPFWILGLQPSIVALVLHRNTHGIALFNGVGQRLRPREVIAGIGKKIKASIKKHERVTN